MSTAAPAPAGLATDKADAQPRRKLRKLVPYFRPYAGRTTVTILLMLVVTAAGLAGPALAQVAIDDGIRAGDKLVLALAVIAFVGAGVVGWFAGIFQSYLASWVGERVLLDLRTQTFRHMMRLELGYHERTPTGRSVSRLTSDIEALLQLVTEGVTSLVINGLTLVGVIAILFWYDWRLALLVFVIMPPLAIGTAWFRVVSTRLYRRTRERVADVLATLQETLAGMRVVQGFGRQEATTAKLAEVNERYRRANYSTIKVSGAYFPSIEMLSAIGTVVILYFGSRMVLDDALTVGVMVAFIGYLSTFFDPIQSLSQLYNTFQSAMAALEKILGVLETEPELDDAPDAYPLPTLRGDVDLEDVTFGYTDDAVLEHIDLHIAAGQTVALVGETGAGKSTLAKLTARFYDPDDGRVLLDGHDVRGVTQASLRSQLSVVPQEGHLFSGTLRDNLRFGKPDATDAEIEGACAAIGALDFINALPGGLDTEIHERGSGLSAGQRQLVSFARALIAQPALLILDEATSSVDLRTEARIERALARLMGGRTSIVIAHRLSTIVGADRIAVVEGGRIVEQGTHDELLAAGGAYAGLYGDWVARASSRR
jgi:ABC-type multidrug transport system fused ATPase/permease subunit